MSLSYSVFPQGQKKKKLFDWYMSKKVHAHTHTHTQTHSLSGQTQLSEMTKKNGICNHCIIKEKKDKWNEGDVFCSCYLLLLRMSSFPFTTYSSLKFL